MAKAPETVEKTEKESLPAVKAENLPSTSVVNFEEDAGAGTENITARDRVIPFVNILQKLSKQINKRDVANYVEGAEEGMFFNTASKKLYNGETGIIVIPIVFQRRYTLWVPRAKGGGLVNDFGSDDSYLAKTTKNDKKQDVDAEGNELVQSLVYYAFIVDPETGAYEGIVLSMSGTQQKRARQWNSVITSIQIPRANGSLFNPAMWYMGYKLTTIPDSNDSGDWMSYKIESYKPTTELPGGAALYAACKQFRESILQGLVKADAAAEGRHEEGAGSGAGSSGGKTDGKDIPF